MKKFNNEVKTDLYNYLTIENKNDQDIKEAIKYLEQYHFKSVVFWHDDNYYNECNYGLLFGLCGLNGQRQNAMQELMKDCFNISIF